MTFLCSLCPRQVIVAIVAVVALVIGSAATARADFVIDDFSAPSSATTYSITSVNPNPFSAPPTALGGGLTRSATIEVISGIGAFSATGQIGGGIFELSTPAQSTAVATLNYSYASPSNFAAVSAESIVMAFTFSDLNVPYSLTLHDALGGSATVNGIASSGPGTYVTPLSAFGGVDFSQISGLDVVLNRDSTGASTTSADFVLDEVRVPTNPIPSPPAALLALSVLPVFALRRMMRRKSA